MWEQLIRAGRRRLTTAVAIPTFCAGLLAAPLVLELRPGVAVQAMVGAALAAGVAALGAVWVELTYLQEARAALARLLTTGRSEP